MVTKKDLDAQIKILRHYTDRPISIGVHKPGSQTLYRLTFDDTGVRLVEKSATVSEMYYALLLANSVMSNAGLESQRAYAKPFGRGSATILQAVSAAHEVDEKVKKSMDLTNIGFKMIKTASKKDLIKDTYKKSKYKIWMLKRLDNKGNGIEISVFVDEKTGKVYAWKEKHAPGKSVYHSFYEYEHPVVDERGRKTVVDHLRSIGYKIGGGEKFRPSFLEPAREKKMSAVERKSLKTSDFAIPAKKKYPIHDKKHAIAALAYVAKNGTAAEKKMVRAAVGKRYPEINIRVKDSGKNSDIVSLVGTVFVDHFGGYTQAESLAIARKAHEILLEKGYGDDARWLVNISGSNPDPEHLSNDDENALEKIYNEAYEKATQDDVDEAAEYLANLEEDVKTWTRSARSNGVPVHRFF